MQLKAEDPNLINPTTSSISADDEEQARSIAMAADQSFVTRKRLIGALMIDDRFSRVSFSCPVFVRLKMASRIKLRSRFV